MTVVDRTHRPFVSGLGLGRRIGEVLYQHEDRGTAVGVLYGLSRILAEMPHALVVMTPSDHAVGQPWQFRAGLSVAMSDLAQGRSGVVLFGAEPTTASSDYGWITAAPTGGSVRSVDTFVEKPTRAHAIDLLRTGAVLNTMVLLARASALEQLFIDHLPGHAAVFAHARKLPAGERDAFLRDEYPRLAPADFSRDVLTHAPGLGLYTWPASMGWCDLGTPERYSLWSRSLRHPVMTAAQPFAAAPARH